MRKLLPVILILLGLAGGGGAGLMLQPASNDDGHAEAEAGPAPADHADGHGSEAPAADAHAAEPSSEGDGHAAQSKPEPDDSIEVVGGASDGHGGEGEPGGFEYVKLANQFVVPLVENGQVESMMVLTLSLEVNTGGGDAVFAREPKLRDVLLQVLFDHANADGFRGRFTDAEAMLPLRRALREAAMSVLPDTVSDVLIADIVRHDS